VSDTKQHGRQPPSFLLHYAQTDRHAELVDELHIDVIPVLLGSGLRLCESVAVSLQARFRDPEIQPCRNTEQRQDLLDSRHMAYNANGCL